jgi:hypothetical protein
MKFIDPKHITIFTVCTDENATRYLRIKPKNIPLWYVGTPSGFDLLALVDGGKAQQL